MEEAKKPPIVHGLYAPTAEDKARYEDFSIAILTPHADFENPTKFTKSVTNLVAYSWMQGLKIYQMGHTERMVPDWARNELARAARQKLNEYTGEKFTHLLWLDDDHVFEPDLACALARHDKDMVSALYYARTGKTLPVVYVKDYSEDEYKHFPIIEVPNCLFECDAVGFGALLMRRDVLDRVPEPWFTIDWRAGEDIAFCVRAKKHGVRVWCDGQYKLGHIAAPQVIGHQDYLRYMREHKDEFADKVKIQLGVE